MPKLSLPGGGRDPSEQPQPLFWATPALFLMQPPDAAPLVAYDVMDYFAPTLSKLVTLWFFRLVGRVFSREQHVLCC